jgi:hypothetical protein
MDFAAATGVVLHAIGLALVFGGTAALSFAVAPQMFRALRPVEAGRVFGRVLRVFDAMAWWGSLLAVAGAALGMAVVVAPAGVAGLLLAASIHVVVTLLRRSVAPRMAALKPPQTEDEERAWDPAARRDFDALHRMYVRLYSANLFLSLAGLVLAVLPR